jgi:hypothetical protein
METSSPHYKDFTRLSPNVWYRPPPPTALSRARAANAGDDDSTGAGDGGEGTNPHRRPDLIILCAWMAAAPRHIAKYIAGHDSLFPPTASAPYPVPFLVVTCSVGDITWRSQAAHESALAPGAIAAHAALSLAALEPGRTPRALLHVFSNGGAHSALALARLTARGGPLFSPASPSPPSSSSGPALGACARLVLDSTPGAETFASGFRALSAAAAGLPWPLRLLARAAVPFVLAGMVLRSVLTLRRSFVARLRRGVNDPELFCLPASPSSPSRGERWAGRRVYLYSRADEMVDWRAVEAHAAEAKAKGYVVTMEEFVGSRHVGHVQADGGRYWAAVRRLVED